MGAVLSPHRLSVFQMDIVERANLGAFTAGDAGIGRIKFLGMDAHRVEKAVDDAAVHSILEGDRLRRKRLAIRYQPSGPIDCPLRLPDDLPGLFLSGGGKHGNVVFRHGNGKAALICQRFPGAQLAKIFSGVSNVLAAGHDKIDLAISG